MPPRRKQPPATKTESELKTAAAIPTPGKWKGWVIGFLFALILLTGIFSTGVLNSLFAGPKIPLPRQVIDLTLGMDMDEVLKKFPGADKKLRPFNNDPQFRIVTLGSTNGVTGATSLDLLFYMPNKKLYFISAMWESDTAKNIPVEEMAKQYRRWAKKSSGSPESLGNDVILKEWQFNDNSTEMTLRDLDYSSHLQRWQDVRDDTNDAAQSAFAKYRLDAGS